MRRLARRKPPLWWPLNRRHALVRGLEACYLFQEGGGTRLNESRRLSPATVGLSTITWSPLAALQGRGLTSAATTSTTPGVTISPSIALSGANVAIEVWLTNTGSDTYGTLLAQEVTLRGFWTRNSGGGFVLDYVDSTGADVLSTGATLSHGTLYQVGVTSSADGANHDYYVNGRLDSSVAGSFPTVTLNTMLNDSASDTFIGTLHLLRVWSRRLHPAEWRALYDQPFAMFAALPSRGQAMMAPTARTNFFAMF